MARQRALPAHVKYGVFVIILLLLGFDITMLYASDRPEISARSSRLSDGPAQAAERAHTHDVISRYFMSHPQADDATLTPNTQVAAQTAASPRQNVPVNAHQAVRARNAVSHGQAPLRNASDNSAMAPINRIVRPPLVTRTPNRALPGRTYRYAQAARGGGYPTGSLGVPAPPALPGQQPDAPTGVAAPAGGADDTGGQTPRSLRRAPRLPTAGGPVQLRRRGGPKVTTSQRRLKLGKSDDFSNAQIDQIIEHTRDNAYRSMVTNSFPMTPEQIVGLKRKLRQSQRAAAAPAHTPPKPVSNSIVVNLAPGSTPPVIRLSLGFVSSLVFLDATGEPWPIESYDIGNPKIFNIQWNKSSNMLLLQALQPYTYGNMAVKLVGLNTPVMLTLIPGQREVDYRVDVRVQEVGPNANTNMMDDGLPQSADQKLLSLLSGVPPKGARSVTVHGSQSQAWVDGDKMYFRSRFKVLSPGWTASMTSADGTNAYEMYKTSVVLVSKHGKVISMKVGS